jgi:hypothetical protein
MISMKENTVEQRIVSHHKVKNKGLSPIFEIVG